MAFLTRAMTSFPKVRRILMTGYTNPELLARCTGWQSFRLPCEAGARGADVGRDQSGDEALARLR
jgi:hypothetical protein